MICILGYTANASAIPLHAGEAEGVSAEGGEAAGAGEAAGEVVGEVAERALRFLVRAVTGGAGEAHNGDSTPVHAAAAFFLIIKFTRGE